MYDGMSNLQEQFEDLLQKAQSIHQGSQAPCASALLARTGSTSGHFSNSTVQEKYPTVDLLRGAAATES
jgi:hypothetical protein